MQRKIKALKTAILSLHSLDNSTKAASKQSEPHWKRESRFLAALNNGDTPMAWAMLNGIKGPPIDPDVRIMSGGASKPAIYIAVEKDYLEMAELLIKSGCSVNQCSCTGDFPLHVAVQRNNMPMVRLLLKSGANVFCGDRSGKTALHLASSPCTLSNLDMVQLLVDSGSPVNQRDKSGATPLSLACQFGHRAVALHLLSQGADARGANLSGSTPLHHACVAAPHDVELVDRLLAAGAPCSRKKVSCIGKKVFYIVSDGSGPYFKDIVVQELNTPGVFFRIQIDATPLLEQCCQQLDVLVSASPAVVWTLVRQGADPNAYVECSRSTVLHLAVGANDEELARLLVRYGSDPFAVDGQGRSALYYALHLHQPLALWMLRACPVVGNARRWLGTLLRVEGFCGSGDPTVEAFISELAGVPTLQQLCSLVLRRQHAYHLDSLAAALPPGIQRSLLQV
ncbi:hypothetical protein HPB48_016153 [Haemaphysalis longicornis]|uniref:Uncharacterized protein n=1 Tax=Haemaphysalis longicornis TaxID=44386 RepID=A0A9J6GG82_HAELO|nr:hypothetical protein HPB48_016153 [Haemaphysalis longicornis]